MTNRFAERKLYSVDIFNINRAVLTDGEYLEASIKISIASVDGREGPLAVINIACPCSAGESIESAENAILAAARDLINRLSSETTDSLWAARQGTLSQG